MIITLFRDTRTPSWNLPGPGSVDGGWSGFALGLVDLVAGRLLVLLDVRGRNEVGDVVRLAASGLERPLHADHEVPDHVLRDQERPLQVNDRVGRGIEVDDVIRGLAVPVDLVRQAPTAPRGRLDDLAAGAGNLPADLLQERLDAVIRRIRPDHEHEFVAAHGRSTPSCGVCPARGPRNPGRQAEQKGLAESTTCLLYTSDAADDLLCVDLGGRRIIKK